MSNVPEGTIKKIEKIEKICNRDVGRGINGIAEYAADGLLKAAMSVAFHPSPNVAILTGFYIPHGTPPAAETDGPVGTAHLAAGLANAGVPVRVVTDSPCADVVRIATQTANIRSKITLDEIRPHINEFENGSENTLLDNWKDSAVTHVISLERVGPASDGVPRNMKGNEIAAHTAPLHLLFDNGEGKITIGIGDGGNELGMGSVPQDIIHSSIRNGEKIACCVPCDHLVVCGVSNWGGFALTAAISLLRPDCAGAFKENLTLENDYNILKNIVEKGPAVDGVTGEQTLSVDGHAWDFHAKVLKEVLEVVES